MKYKKYSIEELFDAIKNSTSIRQALITLKLAPQGGSYETIKRAIKKYNIDTSHFIGKGWSKGKTLSVRIDTEVYLSNQVKIQSFKLKNRLIKENILNKVCSNCNLTEWLGKPIPIELDHIDGNTLNNNLDNLRLLCPNCHAFTDTYRGKNKNKVSNTDS